MLTAVKPIKRPPLNYSFPQTNTRPSDPALSIVLISTLIPQKYRDDYLAET